MSQSVKKKLIAFNETLSSKTTCHDVGCSGDDLTTELPGMKENTIHTLNSFEEWIRLEHQLSQCTDMVKK